MAFEWLEELVNPGAGDKRDARKSGKRAEQQWTDLQGAYDKDEVWDPVTGQWRSNMAPGSLFITDDPQQMNTPGALREYGYGANEYGINEDFLDPTEASAQGLQGMSAFDPRMFDGSSNWAGTGSSFASRDPSAFGGVESEFSGLDPSAFEGVAYDQDALSRMRGGGDYFADLSSGGSDPIAEAQFARRAAEAEASRRANTDAALAAEEARGAGSGSGRLLAELSNQQASVGDQYLAGLDANAMAAQRRDFAAREGANIGQMIGSERRALDTSRAQGLDSAAQERARGVDAFGAERARGLDTYTDQNARGQDAFNTSRNQGLDDFATERMAGMDDWAQQRYTDYYGTSERNAARDQSAMESNVGRMRNIDDNNVVMRNTASTYNAVERPQAEFGNRNTMAQGGSNAATGTAGIYQQNAAMAPDWGGRFLQAGSNVVTAAAGRPKPGGQ